VPSARMAIRTSSWAPGSSTRRTRRRVRSGSSATGAER
jgi:hypothetical protein